MTGFVIYTRLSPEDRGNPGRSLSAQRRDIAFFLSNFTGARPWVVKRFCDRPVITGPDHPQLCAALALCRETGAGLLVARLDRIPFHSLGHVPFFADPLLTLQVAALPDATPAELQTLARMIGQEREFDLLKAQRQETGGLDALTRTDSAEALAGTRAQAAVLPIVLPMRESGSTLREIAAALNQRGWTTETGTAWRPTHVSRLFRQLG